MAKRLRCTMPDGSKWDVLAEPIARARAEYYAEHGDGYTKGSPEYKKCMESETAYALSGDGEADLIDYAQNNMDWDDVKASAVKVEDPDQVDYQEGWVNGDKEFVED